MQSEQLKKTTGVKKPISGQTKFRLELEQQLLSLEDKSMKMSRIALAMLVAAPLAAANAGVTVTPLMLGYTWQDTKNNNGRDHLSSAPAADLKDDLFVGAALGVELTPWLGFEAE